MNSYVWAICAAKRKNNSSFLATFKDGVINFSRLKKVKYNSVCTKKIAEHKTEIFFSPDINENRLPLKFECKRMVAL